MGQETTGIDSGRFRNLRKAVAEHKGLNLRDRREEVISQVAQSSLDKEPEDVQERGIHKYWEVKEGDTELPVLVIAPHAPRASQGELISRLQEKFSEDDRTDIVQAVNNWLEAPIGEKPHETAPEDDPLRKYYRIIRLMRNKADPATDGVARLAAGGEENQVDIMVAKKSRMGADANRHSWFHRPRGVGKEAKFVQTAEYPTSIRASWFWQLRRTLRRTVGLNENSQLEKPFLQLVVHRMANRIEKDTGERYDVVIGGGNAKEGEEGYLADPEVIRWFTVEITKRLAKERVKVGAQADEIVQVAIDTAKDGQVEVFSVGETNEVTSKRRKRIGVGLSGKGLGLEYFRTGHVFEKATEKKGEEASAKSLPSLHFPGFGPKLQTLQVEFSGDLLRDEAKRRAVGEVLHDLVSEFPERFNSSTDLQTK